MKSSFLCIAIAFCFASCTKTDIKPEAVTSTAAVDNLSVAKTRSNYLVSHPWIYQGFYFQYADPQHKGDPQYVRGASNNILDLDATKYVFKNNGTFVEYDGGYTYPGTWKFSDNTASLLILDFHYYVDKDSVLVLNSNHFNYTQPIGYHNKAYTELIPAQ